MPRTKQKKGAVVSKETKRETKKAGDDLQSALFKYNKTTEFLEESSDLINDAIADWCIKIVGDGERKPNAYPEPETYLYWLADAGATIFSTYRKKIPQNPELLKITQQLAALCFPYIPSRKANFYSILEKNYLTPHNQTGYLVSYFFFLRNLLVEKNIDFSIRFACLSGALQFYTVYRKYLTNAFVERMFTLLNSSEAKAFFLEYKQISQEQTNDLKVYIPHYQFLTRQGKEFWQETVTSPNIEAWIHNLRKKITKAIKEDNAFIKEYKLTDFSLFNKELEEFIQLLLLNKEDVNSKELKEEIFLPTREVREQIASFTDRDHPLREFFSAELLDSLRKKNQLKPQQLLKECEEEEAFRLLRESEKTQAMQHAESEKKAQAEQLELERKNKREAKEAGEKKEKEFRGLLTLLNEFSASLQRSIKFINELPINPENKNKARQQFKAEFGKLNSELKAIYHVINLKTKNFIIDNNVSNALIEIENKIKNHESFDESQINLLFQEIAGIKSILEKAKQVVNDIIQKLNTSYTEINSLSIKHSDLWSDLIQKGKMNKKLKRELGKLISEKEKLISKFHQYELALREYIQIIPLSTEQTTQLNDLFFNVAALEKLSNQLDKEYEHSFTPNETSKKKIRPKVEATQSNPSCTSITFVKTPENDTKNQSSKVLPISALPENYGEAITELKAQLFTTLAVVHLISKITFNQGRGKLAYIYIENLKTYKERLKEASISLSQHEINLDTVDDSINARMQEEKEELKRLDKCIDSLIFIVKTYGKGEKEFYQVDFEKDDFNRLLYFFKKELIPEAVTVELMQKGFLSEEEVNREDCFSQIQKLETRLRENKLLLDNAFFSNSGDISAIREKNAEIQELLEEKYVELERINANLRNSYIAGQRYTAPHYETIHRPVLPLISIIPTVTVVPVISIAQPFNFFQLQVAPVVNAAMIPEVTRTVNNSRSSN